jgi:16S rRNA (adenine1518-N6/adenine1519-N6)-dimethyltransferase
MLTITQTLDLLRKLHFHPKKSLGQNFLVDPNIVQKSLVMAELCPRDVVVEIGPGLGALTQELLQKFFQVYAVEYDKHLYAYLWENLGEKYKDCFHLLLGDAVKFPIAGKPALEEYKVVANLPYAISTPWMEAILNQETLPSRMVLLLQRETAERFWAKIGTKAMGPMAIFLQSAYDMKEMHPVSRRCFFPEPNIDSILLSLDRKKNPVLFSREEKFNIRHFFTGRRKQMKHLISKHLEPTAAHAWLTYLRDGGISDKARPEDIPIVMWQRSGSLSSEGCKSAIDFEEGSSAIERIEWTSL